MSRVVSYFERTSARGRHLGMGDERPTMEQCPRRGSYYKAGHSKGSWLYEVFVDGRREPQCVEAHSSGWAVVLDESSVSGKRKIEGTVEIKRVNG